MKEIKKEVKTFQISLECDCGGAIVFDSNNGVKDSRSDKPTFKHICLKCTRVEYLENIYPRVHYEYKGKK